MRWGFIWLLGMTPSLASAGTNGALQWSPDGRWVAYTVRTERELTCPPAGWIFGNAADPLFRPRPVDEPSTPPHCSRIYAVEVGTASAVLLETSDQRLSSPCWSPDGRLLAFVRLADGGSVPVRIDVVIQDSPRHSRVLTSRTVAGGVRSVTDAIDLFPAWSPDGRFLAVPDLENLSGLSVLRADNGRVIKSVEKANAPAWSPDGTKLAFLRRGKTSSLHVLETGFGPTRLLADLGESYGSPVWSRDGRSVLVVARRLVDRRRGPMPQFPTLSVDLVRVEADSGSIATVANLGTEPADHDEAPRGVYFAIDRDGEDLYSSVDADNQPSVVVHYQPTTQITVDRTPALDSAVRVTGLALAPNGKTLALRFGWPGPGATAAFWDVESKVLTPIVSDDRSRKEWVTLLIATAGQLVRLIPLPSIEGKAVERPTFLPAPGELASNDETLFRLRRVGRLGRPLCDRTDETDVVGPAFDAFLKEARLVFDASREDFPDAVGSLAALETRSFSPDQHLRLLALRAQLFLGLKDFERAGDTVAYLRTVGDLTTSRYEVTPVGVVLTPEPVPTNGWARFLSARLDALSRSGPGGDDEAGEPAGRRGFMPPGFPPRRPIPFDQIPDAVFVRPRVAPPLPPRGDAKAAPRFPFRRPGAIPRPPRVIPPLPVAPR